ncbi:MAG: peroxide stress protein YaaA [Eubacteriales bacterium]|nr:peroxide stress protein YaaA [Eubacteriales bacterium]
MRILISPAKKMISDPDSMEILGLPVFLEQTREILRYLQGLSYESCRKLWGCNDRIARENYERIAGMNLERGLTPAILAYEGIAYRYMAPSVFANGEFAYVQEHLRILSGFYGVLKPMDGVAMYRLEMQAKASVAGTKDLYEYWGERLYREVRGEQCIVNLASREYSRCVEKYLTPEDRYLTCVFGELIGEKVVQKGVYAKMARGEMVRFLAERGAQEPEEMREFNRLGYCFDEKRSDAETYVFLREK